MLAKFQHHTNVPLGVCDGHTEMGERERERQVYLQPDGLDSNTYNTYNINIIKYLQYGRHTGTTNICLLPIVQSPWY